MPLSCFLLHFPLKESDRRSLTSAAVICHFVATDSQ